MSDVATVGTLKPVSPKRDLSLLSDDELEGKSNRRLRAGCLLGVSSIVPAVSAIPVAIALGGGSLNTAVALSALGAAVVSFFGGLAIDRRSYRYSRVLQARKAEAERYQLESWQAATIAELRDRFAIDFEIEDLGGLKYPREAPATKSTVRYGTIEKLIENSEGEGARLEQLTLVWSNGEPRILRAVTELRDIHGGAIR